MHIKSYKQTNQKLVTELKQLEAICMQHDGQHIPIYWEILEQHREKANDFYIYNQNRLIGYFSAFLFSDNEFEISAMLHPDYRKQGLFSQCLQKVKAIAKQLEVERFIFVSPTNIVATEATLKAIGATYISSEYYLAINIPTANHTDGDQRGALDSSLEGIEALAKKTALIKADLNDCETLANLDAKSFHSDKALMLKRFNTIINDAHRHIWLLMLENHPIGKIHVRINNETASLHDLCILPEHQGLGYGFCMLQETLEQIFLMGIQKINLTVNTDNSNALKLYQKAGFEIRQIYNYSSLPLNLD